MYIFNSNNKLLKNMGYRIEYKFISLVIFCFIVVIRRSLMFFKVVIGFFCFFLYKVCKNEVNLIKC